MSSTQRLVRAQLLVAIGLSLVLALGLARIPFTQLQLVARVRAAGQTAASSQQLFLPITSALTDVQGAAQPLSARNPAFAVVASAAPAQPRQGDTVALSAKVTDLAIRRALVNIVVSVRDLGGSVVHRRAWINQYFAIDSTVTLNESFQPEAGGYTIGVQIIKSDQTTTYYNNSTLASFTIAAAPVPNLPRMTTPITAPPRMYGVLQPHPEYQSSTWNAGARIRTLELGWDVYEPQEGVWNLNYIQQKQHEYQQAVASGYKVVLEFGLQNPPSWIFGYPNSRFVNQYGDSFAGGIGENGVDAVFNQTMRDKQAAYVRQVFADFGTNFFAVRLGWGFYGELNYPLATFNGHTNSYWAYDAIAQGRAVGIPAGMRPTPVPGWFPGTTSAGHASASTFVNWYIDSLKNYHDWQISTVRSVYGGTLFMLYPDWGLRPGQLDAAIAVDLNGTTPPEINGDVPRAFDYARFVTGITDPGVALYTTWLDAPNTGDSGTDQAEWSPVHYLASLASAHSLHPGIWGENSGHNTYDAMQYSLSQAHIYGLQGVMWAFEGELYSGQYATLAQYAALIAQYP